MTGNEILESKKTQKIDNLIETHSEYPSLRGFRDFMASMSSKSILDYIYYIISFLDYCKKEPRDLELDDYSGYLSTLKQKTPSYQTSAYAALKKYSYYLFVSKKNADNPMQYIERPSAKERQETIEKRENGYLTKSEVQKVLMAIKNGVGNHHSKERQKDWKDRDYLIFLIFLSTGIRLSALIQLDLDSIDFENKQLITTDKGSKVNQFPLSDEVLVYAKSWLNKREELLDGKEEQALFISVNRERMSTSAVSDVVGKYSSVISGKHITPHKLRATFGTQVYNATHDIYLTQKAMNHSSPTVTEKYVRGNKDNSKTTASEVMRRNLFGK